MERIFVSDGEFGLRGRRNEEQEEILRTIIAKLIDENGSVFFTM